MAHDPRYFGVSEVPAEMQDSAQSPGNSESFCGVIAMPAKRSGDGQKVAEREGFEPSVRY